MGKTILFLGASHQQLAPIVYARRAGHRIVTCDNRPDNPGHSIADAYHNVSTTDLDGVLGVARKEQIDAVVCYASDVAAPAAAYVSEKIGLPGNPSASVDILTNKAKFRKFQENGGYFTPKHVSFGASDVLDGEYIVKRVREAMDFPLIVKPVDASGAKGVTKLLDEANLLPATSHALEFSRAKTIIVEELVTPMGFQVCGEGFLQDGWIIFFALANEHFCDGLAVPVGESFPSIFSEDLASAARVVVQQIMSDLNMRHGPFNLDLMFLPAGEIFVIEIGPRNGGNRMPEAIQYAYQVDTIGATVEAALGASVDLHRKASSYCATYSIHSKRDGIFKGVSYSTNLQKKIVDEKLFCLPGERVYRFTMGSLMLGNLILSFDSYADMLRTMSRMDEHVTVDMRD